MKNMFNVTTVLPHNLLQTNPCIRHNFSTQVFRKRAAQLHYVGRYIFWPPSEARKCSAAQGPHSEVVPRAFWRFVSKSCDECKGSFARGCEAKRWSHWTRSSLGAQGPHSDVMPRDFWRLVSKSCDECKGSFARDCEAKRVVTLNMFFIRNNFPAYED